jgi:hypothetical protein
VKSLENVISVEYDMHRNCVYWADIVNDIISVSDIKSFFLIINNRLMV